MADAVTVAGAVAPEGLRVTIAPGGSGLDLSTVTGVTVALQSRDGEVKTWTLGIVSQSTTELVVRRSFQANDVPRPEIYRGVISLAVPGGTRRCQPIRLIVIA